MIDKDTYDRIVIDPHGPHLILALMNLSVRAFLRIVKLEQSTVKPA